jgi:hypothetical protein
MKYPAKRGAVLKLWHPAASVRESEKAFGRVASISHQVGERRKQGDKRPYRDSYCYFEFLPSARLDSVGLITKTVAILKRKKTSVSKLLATGGVAVLAIKVADRDFVQLYVQRDQLAALAALGVSLVIE